MAEETNVSKGGSRREWLRRASAAGDCGADGLGFPTAERVRRARGLDWDEWGVLSGEPAENEL